MNNENKQKVYLLGEQSGVVTSFKLNKTTVVTEFFTISFTGGESIGLFLSKLDAEICRQYLNTQEHEGKKNKYELITCNDSRVEILRDFEKLPFRLITGFVLDAHSKKLVIQGGCYSVMHFGLSDDESKWILWNENRPEQNTLSLLRSLFLHVGEGGYIEEIEMLNDMDQHSLENLAKEAVIQNGLLPKGIASKPAVFSPSRKRWIELNLGGPYGSR